MFSQRASRPLTVNTEVALPADTVINLSTTAGSNGGFYLTNDHDADFKATGTKITSIVLKAGQTKTSTFYYQQIGDTTSNYYYDYYINIPARLTASALSPGYSTWDGYGYASTYLGKVNSLEFTSGSNSLEQNQPGSYTVTSYDDHHNPTPFIPVNNNNSKVTMCLYALTDSTTGKLTASSNNSCPSPTSTLAPVLITMGQSSYTFSYNDQTIGTHKLTLATDSNGTGISATKTITVTPAVTTQIVFSRPVYTLKRDQALNNVTFKLMSTYGIETNSLGAISINLTSSSTTAKFKDPSNDGYQKTITYNLPASVTEGTISYIDHYAQPGTATVKAVGTANTSLSYVPNVLTNFLASLVSSNASAIDSPVTITGSTKVSLITGSVASIRISSNPLTLERGQTSNINLTAYDSYGMETAVASDLCLYLNNPTTTDTNFNFQSIPTTSCKDITMGGNTYQSVSIPAGQSSISFETTAKASSSVGSYQVIVNSNPLNPTDGLVDSQTETIIYGDVKGIKLDKGSYTLERGQTIPMELSLVNSDNVVTPATKNYYFTLNSASATARLSPDDTSTNVSNSLNTTISQGNTSADLLYYDTTLGTVNLTVTQVDSSFNNLTTKDVSTLATPVTVIYGAITQIIFTNEPLTTTANHTSDTMTIVTRNSSGFNTPVPDSNGLTLLVGTNDDSGEFSLSGQDKYNWGINRLTIPQGSSSISFVYRDSLVGIHTISVNGQTNSNLVASQSHTITKQVFDHFIVTNISTPEKAGTPSSVVVFAVDSASYVVEDYNGTITFSADSADAMYPKASYTFIPDSDKGIHTFTNGIAFKQPGIKAITVTDTNNKTGTQSNIIVLGANTNDPAKLIFLTPDSSNQPVNVSLNELTPDLTLQMLDSLGNPTVAHDSPYQIELTSDSSTGVFTSDNKTYQSTITLPVEDGLSFTTQPVYFRDSVSGTRTITAKLINPSNLASTVASANLIVNVNNLDTASTLKLASKDTTGSYQPNSVLFPYNSNNTIDGQVELTKQATNLNQLIKANFVTTLTNQAGQVVDQVTSSNIGVLDYLRSSITQIGNSNQLYNLAAKVSAVIVNDTKTSDTNYNLPVSSYSFKLSNPSLNPATRNLNFNLTVSDDLTNPVSHSYNLDNVNFKLVNSGLNYNLTSLLGSSLATLTSTNTSSNVLTKTYTITLPIGGLSVNSSSVTGLSTSSSLASLTPTTYFLGTVLKDNLLVTLNSNTINTSLSNLKDKTSTILATSLTKLDLTASVVAPVAPVKPVVPPAVTPSAPAAPVKPAAPTPNSGTKTPVVTPTPPANQSLLAKILSSKYAPYIIPGIFLFVIFFILIALIYQAYKEYKQAKFLLSLANKNKQTYLAKEDFLRLSSHYLRTPVTLVSSAVDLLTALPGSSTIDKTTILNLTNISDNLVKKVNSIIELISSSKDSLDINKHTKVKVAFIKILLNPVVYLPVILSIGLTLGLNYVINNIIKANTINVSTIINQVLILTFGLIVLYTVARVRYMRHKRNELIKDYQANLDKLTNLETNLITLTYHDLTDDVLHLTGINLTELNNKLVEDTIAEGKDRLENLIARFSVLVNILDKDKITLNSFNLTKAVNTAVDQYNDSSSYTKLILDTTALTNTKTSATISSNNYLITQVLSTTLASLADTKSRTTNIKLSLARDKSTNRTKLTILGRKLDQPAATSLYSIYSNEQTNEQVQKAADLTKLDLYLDKAIMLALGGNITAKLQGDSSEVTVEM